MSLPSLLGFVVTGLQAHPLCEDVAVIETRAFSPDQFFLKVRAKLPDSHKLQVRIYFNRGHTDYAYQLFAAEPLLRWDNKEEFRHLPTFPHHYHDDKGNVLSSPLSGDVIVDLQIVLTEISGYFSRRAHGG